MASALGLILPLANSIFNGSKKPPKSINDFPYLTMLIATGSPFLNSSQNTDNVTVFICSLSLCLIFATILPYTKQLIHHPTVLCSHQQILLCLCHSVSANPLQRFQKELLILLHSEISCRLQLQNYMLSHNFLPKILT